MIPERKLSQGSSVSSPLRSDSYNTYSSPIRQKSTEDGDLYIAGQGLVPVVNNPGLHPSNSGSFGILSWSTSAVDKAWNESSILPMTSHRREIGQADFADYLQRLGIAVDKYMFRRMSIKQDDARKMSLSEPEGCGYLRGEGLVQALRQVPTLFFQEDFCLTRPGTFSQVIRGDTLEERSSTLETLMGYVDIVETEISNEIAARSESFFEAAESLQDLQQSIGDTLFQIQRLHVHAHNLDGGLCARAGQIQRLSKQRKNLEECLRLLQIVESVTHAQETVNLLLLAHDYPSCLQLIDDLRRQYRDKSKDGLGSEGMKKVLCLKHIPDALDASVVTLNSCLVGELIELLNWDEAEGTLRLVAARALGEESRMSITSVKDSTVPDYQSKTEKLKQIFIGLSRTGSLSGTFSEVIPHVVSRLNASVRNLTEILLPNFVHMATNDESLQDSGVNAHLQYITHDMFLTLLKSCLAVEDACVMYYVRLGQVIAQATNDSALIHHATLVERGKSDLCQALLDACQAYWMELFAARSQIHHKLNLEQIQELKAMNQSCAELAKKAQVRSSPKLDSLLQTQCKSALNLIHQQNFYDLQQTLEQENWTISQIPPSFRHQIKQCFFNSPPDSDVDISDKPSNTLSLEGRNYHVVNSVLQLISILQKSTKNTKMIPEFVMEIGRHTIELLSFFNTRSCQLILGAQAMRVNHLKSITAKHLALCSQSILLIIHLIEPLMETLLEGSPATKRTILQPEFDRVKQDLRTHLEGLHSKLVSIMEERLQFGIQQIKEVFISLKDSTEIEENIKPSQAAQLIGKQLRILTQVLTPLLHTQQLEDIFNRVVKIFAQMLSTVFGDMTIELNLISPSDSTVPNTSSIEDPSSPHPLQDKPNVESENIISKQRQQASADCLFLKDILSKLPGGEDSKSVLEPLSEISLLLNPVSFSP